MLRTSRGAWDQPTRCTDKENKPEKALRMSAPEERQKQKCGRDRSQFLTEIMLQLGEEKMKTTPIVDDLNKQLVSAYDRMRTRKFTQLVGDGMRISKALATAEAEAKDSLALLAKQRGIEAVNIATGGDLGKRKSVAKELLKRQSIAVAATQRESLFPEENRNSLMKNLPKKVSTITSTEIPHELAELDHVSHRCCRDSTESLKRVRESECTDERPHPKMSVSSDACSSGSDARPATHARKRLRKTGSLTGQERMKSCVSTLSGTDEYLDTDVTADAHLGTETEEGECLLEQSTGLETDSLAANVLQSGLCDATEPSLGCHDPEIERLDSTADESIQITDLSASPVTNVVEVQDCLGLQEKELEAREQSDDQVGQRGTMEEHGDTTTATGETEVEDVEPVPDKQPSQSSIGVRERAMLMLRLQFAGRMFKKQRKLQQMSTADNNATPTPGC